jgi:hypothetical protein
MGARARGRVGRKVSLGLHLDAVGGHVVGVLGRERRAEAAPNNTSRPVTVVEPLLNNDIWHSTLLLDEPDGLRA